MKIAHPYGGAVGGGDDHNLFGVKLAERQALHRVRAAKSADHQIKPATAQPRRKVKVRAFVNLQKRVGILARKLQHHLRQQGSGHAWQCPHLQKTRRTAPRLHAPQAVAQRGSALFGKLKKNLALGRQPHARTAAFHQYGTHQILQLFQSLGDGGLGQVQLFGRAFQAARSGDGTERIQMAELDGPIHMLSIFDNYIA